MGDKWEEGISTSQRLTQANTLLPLKETLPLIEDYNSKQNLYQTEPNYTETETNSGFEKHCCCQNSTKSSSLSLDNKLESNSCKCHVSVNKSINSNGSEEYVDIKSVKERHISIDSARDSGIGENSNFTDNLDENNDIFPIENGRNSSNSECYTKGAQSSKKFSDLRGYWQPKVKKSLADRLPENSFHLVPPNRYIFPGAEVYYDPDEKLHYEGDSSSSSSSDIDSESESQSATMF